ncbi:MAG: nucleoside monophosphate kinase [bacterium]
MTPTLFVIFGRSGCGKGTQSNLLTKYLNETDPNAGVFYVSTGDELRKLAKAETISGKETKRIIDSGEFMPAFIAVLMWATVMTRDYKEGMHMILDGSPRKLEEADIFDSVAPFYKLGKPKMVYMNVSKEWATDKLLKRALSQGRADDAAESIERRMKAFDESLYPVINSYRERSDVDFMEINGEQTIEEVHKAIMSALDLK